MPNQHAGPPQAGGPPIPEPTYAERARTLVYLAKTGTLATLSEKHPGHPFASVLPYALARDGAPLFLISTMAMHTQNLKRDSRASLLITQTGWEGDPLAGGRVTLVGNVSILDSGGIREARESYLKRHANAAYWVDFDDFSFYRMQVMDVYFVGGFAAMGWIDTRTYFEASPDSLADSAEGIIMHMNRDHADSLLKIAKTYAGFEAEKAEMTSVDYLGFRLRMKNGERMQGARIPFPREAKSSEECRAIFIEMLRGEIELKR